MSAILTKFKEEMAELRKEWTEFYGQFTKKNEETVDDGISGDTELPGEQA